MRIELVYDPTIAIRSLETKNKTKRQPAAQQRSLGYKYSLSHTSEIHFSLRAVGYANVQSPPCLLPFGSCDPWVCLRSSICGACVDWQLWPPQSVPRANNHLKSGLCVPACRRLLDRMIPFFYEVWFMLGRMRIWSAGSTSQQSLRRSLWSALVIPIVFSLSFSFFLSLILCACAHVERVCVLRLSEERPVIEPLAVVWWEVAVFSSRQTPAPLMFLINTHGRQWAAHHITHALSHGGVRLRQ